MKRPSPSGEGSVMPPDTVAALVDAVRHHHLLEAEQLVELMRDLAPRCADPRALARELVQRDWLTPYQVNQLFQGKGAELVLGAYVLLERLGEGGMGAVFKARHQTLGRIVALKVIRKDRLDSPQAVKRFQREVRAAAQLSHPNIVLAFDADEARGTHFMAMEYVPGTDLAKLVKQQGPLPVETACDYIRQAALGLQHAHERGMVHRDIKPHNLLVTGAKPERGVVKILDLGLARLSHAAADGESSSPLTQENQVMGTPDYIAPEQTLGAHGVDIRADLYSLGCTLYFLLTGKVPFPGGSLGEKIARHLAQETVPVERRRPDVPSCVAAIVRKLMAKRPEDRFQTPAELAAALAQVNEPVAAAPPAATVADNPADLWARVVDSDTVAYEKPKRPAKRIPFDYRWLVAGGAGVLAVGLLLLVIRLFSGGDPGSGKPEGPTADNPSPEKKRDEPRAEDPARAERRRINAAEEALRPLEAMAKEATVEPVKLRNEIRQFLVKHSGTPAATRAGALLGPVLAKIPSPLDQLDAAKIPENAKAAWRAEGSQPPGELVAVLGEHRRRHWGAVKSVAYSPDGKLIASGGEDRLIHIYDAGTFQERLTIKPGGGAIWSVVFSPDSRRLLSDGGGATAFLWEAATGEQVQRFEGHTAPVLAVAFSQDGSRAVTRSRDGTIRIWDVKTGKEFNRLGGFEAETNTVGLSEDGRHVYIHADNENAVRVLEVAGGQEVGSFVPAVGWTRLCFSPDGRHGLFGGQGVGILADLQEKKEVRRVEGHGGTVYGVAFSAAGRLAVTTGTGATMLQVWETATGKIRGRIENLSSIPDTVALSPDGKRVVCGSLDGTVRLWDVASGKEVRPLTGPVGDSWRVRFSPDDRTIYAASGDNRLRCWNLAEGAWKLGSEVPWRSSRKSSPFAVAPDGSILLTERDQDKIAQYTLGNNGIRAAQPLNIPGAIPIVVTFAPDGKTIATGGGFGDKPGLLHLWEKTADQPRLLHVLVGHPDYVSGAAFAPDGRRLASGSRDSTLILWDAATGKEIKRISGAAGPFCQLAFTPDGKFLVSCRTSSVLILNATTGAILHNIGEGNRYPEAGPVCAPDGRSVIYGGWFNGGGFVKQVDLSTGKTQWEWSFPGPVRDLALAADGRHLATANGNGTVYLFRLAQGPPQGR